MRWDFHPEALEEYEQAASYYSEHDPELQLRFIESIEASIERVLEAPTRWREIDDDVRRCLAHVFPYGILYTIEVISFSYSPSCTSAADPVIGRNEFRKLN